MATLVVFIDSFPFGKLSKTPYLNDFETRASITPGFGYSVNQQAMLFDGRTPDDIGTFGEWNYDPGEPTISERLLSPLYYIRGVSEFADRGIHYVLDRKFGVDCSNIPFDYLPYFEHTGEYPLATDNQYETVFHKRGFDIVAPDFEPLAVGEKDETALERAMAAIEDGSERLFVSFPDLDGTAHAHGTNSSEYRLRLKRLDDMVETLETRFDEENEDVTTYVLSDHGMADATESVSIPLTETFGRSTPERAVFFYDSLYLRAWIGDETLYCDVTAFLDGLDCGRILLPAERERYGVSRKIHGDLIFLLNEGCAFVPNYFGLRQQAAYHGYHPELDSQQGIFLSRDREIEQPDTSLDVSHILDQRL